MGKKHGGEGGTPALEIIAGQGVAHELFTHEHDPRSTVGFALETAAALGVGAEHIFKTLMAVVDDSEIVVAVVPADATLNLKRLAAAAGGTWIGVRPGDWWCGGPGPLRCLRQKVFD